MDTVGRPFSMGRVRQDLLPAFPGQRQDGHRPPHRDRQPDHQAQTCPERRRDRAHHRGEPLHAVLSGAGRVLAGPGLLALPFRGMEEKAGQRYFQRLRRRTRDHMPWRRCENGGYRQQGQAQARRHRGRPEHHLPQRPGAARQGQGKNGSHHRFFVRAPTWRTEGQAQDLPGGRPQEIPGRIEKEAGQQKDAQERDPLPSELP